MLARKKSAHLNSSNGTVVFSYPPASRTNPATLRYSSFSNSYTCLGMLEKLIRPPRALYGYVHRLFSISSQKSLIATKCPTPGQLVLALFAQPKVPRRRDDGQS